MPEFGIPAELQQQQPPPPTPQPDAPPVFEEVFQPTDVVEASKTAASQPEVTPEVVATPVVPEEIKVVPQPVYQPDDAMLLNVREENPQQVAALLDEDAVLSAHGPQDETQYEALAASAAKLRHSGN
ncbi:MAG TPA: hypothetical protein VLA04_05055 [Verrucomicrobiae bacterium]|nr:hypothetical protein [Verrucomicrobiae bacterium]